MLAMSSNRATRLMLACDMTPCTLRSFGLVFLASTFSPDSNGSIQYGDLPLFAPRTLAPANCHAALFVLLRPCCTRFAADASSLAAKTASMYQGKDVEG
jgi:hypothetical protein